MDLTDVIRQLESKKRTLEQNKKKEIEKINDKYNQKIDELEMALKVNKEMNTVCLRCNGRGQERYTDAAGDTDSKRCEKCGGTGREPTGTERED